MAKSDHGGGTKFLKWTKGKCVLCGGKTHDVTDEYLTKDEIKKYTIVNECENCGYLGKEIDEFA